MLILTLMLTLIIILMLMLMPCREINSVCCEKCTKQIHTLRLKMQTVLTWQQTVNWLPLICAVHGSDWQQTVNWLPLVSAVHGSDSCRSYPVTSANPPCPVHDVFSAALQCTPCSAFGILWMCTTNVYALAVLSVLHLSDECDCSGSTEF